MTDETKFPPSVKDLCDPITRTREYLQDQFKTEAESKSTDRSRQVRLERAIGTLTAIEALLEILCLSEDPEKSWERWI